MVIYKGISENEVALTFDDGPNPEVTPRILQVLKEKNVKATFFLIGRRAEEYPETVKLIISEGHDVGNHSYSHASGGLLLVGAEKGDQGIIDEIKKASDAIKMIAGITDKELQFYRPQGIKWKNEWGELAKPFFGDNIIMSNVGSNDFNWNDKTHIWDENDLSGIRLQAQKIIADVSSNAEPGSIISLHDSGEYCLEGNCTYLSWMNRALPTLEALPTIIDNLRKKGLTIIRLGEMKPDIVGIKNESKP